MSASPIRAKKSRSSHPGSSRKFDPNRVMEPDVSVVSPLPSRESRPTPVSSETSTSTQTPTQGSSQRWFTPFLNTVLFVVLVSGLVTAALLVEVFLSLWQQIRAHSQQLAEQQIVLQRLRLSQNSMSELGGHLKALDTSTSALYALVDAQAKRIEVLTKGQAGLANQIQGTDAHWQRQWNEFRKNQLPASSSTPIASSAPAQRSPSVSHPTPSASLSPTPTSPAVPEKDGDSFRPELKPHPNAQAHLANNGMVVWLTPRPGFEKLVPTSVINHVNGLGFLVHDWDDNKHYFITDSGGWIATP